jgi:hypothetical protein
MQYAEFAAVGRSESRWESGQRFTGNPAYLDPLY